MTVRHGRIGVRKVVLTCLLMLLAGLGSGHASGNTPRDPWAPFDSPWFDKVSSTEGMPPSIVTALAQDHRGLIWVGTMVGLARYDGYRTQVFDSRGADGKSLPDAYVRCLLALPDRGLLIGTNAGGLVRFDPGSARFQAYPVGKGGTSARKIYGLADDHTGGVWIATDEGLDHLDLRSDQITQLKTGGDTVPRNFSVLQDRAGNLWLGNDNGLFVRYAGSNAFVRPERPAGVVATVLNNQIWAINEDDAGRVWAGSGQAGAVYRDADGSWHAVPGFSGYLHGSQQATVRDFMPLANGSMWIATDGNGVLSYAPGDAQVRTIEHDAAIASSLPGDSVRDLLQDRSGNIWAATDLGVASTNPNARTAFSVLPSPLTQNTLSESSVRAVYVDTRGLIWLGLGSGRIDMIDLHAGHMTHMQLGGSQIHRDVQAFVESGDGAIWVGTQGLARIDPKTLKIHSSMVPALENIPVLTLQRDGARLLVGTYDGIYRYDIRTHALDHIRHDPKDPGSLVSDTIRQITRIGDSWWYGTTQGVSIASNSRAKRGFRNLTHRANDPSSLPQDYVSSVMLDARQRLWISSFGGVATTGHFVADARWHFSSIGVSQGLRSDKVSSMLGDDPGNIWVGTSNGVSRIKGDTLAVSNLGPRDGLHIPSYLYAGAAARAPGGELLFGGLGGLTVIRPQWKPPAIALAPLVVTNAVVNESTLPFGQLPRDGEAIRLNQHSRNLRLDFALLDYQVPKQTAYSYRMEGLDENWIELPVGTMPSANYTNLPHGEYRLHLRATTQGMHPRTVETVLPVEVEPRWYETLLSKIIAVLLLIGFVILLVHLRTLYLRRQAKQLQRQIDEQTRDLRAANRRLDELAATDGLTGAYNRRRFLELAAQQHAQASEGAICIALFDLDRFKQINDTYGHLAGDAVIRTTIEVVRQHTRQHDLVGRYGGEEFVVCLPETNLQQAMETAERIRAALARTSVLHEGKTISVTVSIGVAALRTGESLEQWLSRADGAMYEAKRSGRNGCAAA
ncbi:MAG: diguanylate cyclase [Rhodanobacter sp.]|jgi:diguanylate cyclase (GGDEF)-like protein